MIGETSSKPLGPNRPAGAEIEKLGISTLRSGKDQPVVGGMNAERSDVREGGFYVFKFRRGRLGMVWLELRPGHGGGGSAAEGKEKAR